MCVCGYAMYMEGLCTYEVCYLQFRQVRGSPELPVLVWIRDPDCATQPCAPDVLLLRWLDARVPRSAVRYGD